MSRIFRTANTQAVPVAQTLDTAMQPKDRVMKFTFLNWTSAIPFSTIHLTGTLPAIMLVWALYHCWYAFSREKKQHSCWLFRLDKTQYCVLQMAASGSCCYQFLKVLKLDGKLGNRKKQFLSPTLTQQCIIAVGSSSLPYKWPEKNTEEILAIFFEH